MPVFASSALYAHTHGFKLAFLSGTDQNRQPVDVPSRHETHHNVTDFNGRWVFTSAGCRFTGSIGATIKDGRVIVRGRQWDGRPGTLHKMGAGGGMTLTAEGRLDGLRPAPSTVPTDVLVPDRNEATQAFTRTRAILGPAQLDLASTAYDRIRQSSLKRGSSIVDHQAVRDRMLSYGTTCANLQRRMDVSPGAQDELTKYNRIDLKRQKHAGDID